MSFSKIAEMNSLIYKSTLENTQNHLGEPAAQQPFFVRSSSSRAAQRRLRMETNFFPIQTSEMEMQERNRKLNYEQNGPFKALHGQMPREMALKAKGNPPSYAELVCTQKDKKLIAKRQAEARAAGRILGVEDKDIYFLNLADQRLDTYPLLDLTKAIEKINKEVQADLVYTHYWNDLNLDHRLTTQAVLTAFRPKPGKINTVIRHFEIPESTYLAVPGGQNDFVPNVFVDIKSTLDLKLKALNAYESEKREYPDLRSERFIKQLAVQRGKEANCAYAEAFVEIKGKK